MKVVVSMKRDIIEEYLCRSWLNPPSRLVRKTHCIIKAAECINVSFLRFTSVLLSVALAASVAVRQITLGAHSK